MAESSKLKKVHEIEKLRAELADRAAWISANIDLMTADQLKEANEWLNQVVESIESPPDESLTQ